MILKKIIDWKIIAIAYIKTLSVIIRRPKQIYKLNKQDNEQGNFIYRKSKIQTMVDMVNSFGS